MGAKIGNRRWAIIVLMLLSYSFMYICRTSISIAGPVMMKELSWSATEFGLVSTAFFIGYAVTMLPAGYLADYFGSGKIMVSGILLYSLFTFLTPLGTTIGALIFLRALVGVGQGVIFPANGSLLAKWIPKKEAGTAQGLVMLGTPMGIMLTMPLAIFFLQYYNWQTLFYACAFLGPIWIFLWRQWGANKPESCKNITAEELAYIKADHKAVPNAGVTRSTGTIFKSFSVWTSALGYFSSSYLFFLLLPGYLHIL